MPDDEGELLTAEMIDHGFLAAPSPAYFAFRALERWIVDRADVVNDARPPAIDVDLADLRAQCDARAAQLRRPLPHRGEADAEPRPCLRARPLKLQVIGDIAPDPSGPRAAC